MLPAGDRIEKGLRPRGTRHQRGDELIVFRRMEPVMGLDEAGADGRIIDGGEPAGCHSIEETDLEQRFANFAQVGGRENRSAISGRPDARESPAFESSAVLRISSRARPTPKSAPSSRTPSRSAASCEFECFAANASHAAGFGALRHPVNASAMPAATSCAAGGRVSSSSSGALFFSMSSASRRAMQSAGSRPVRSAGRFRPARRDRRRRPE